MIFAKKKFVIKNGLYLEVSTFAEHPNVGWDQEIGFHHVKHAATNLKIDGKDGLGQVGFFDEVITEVYEWYFTTHK